MIRRALSLLALLAGGCVALQPGASNPPPATSSGVTLYGASLRVGVDAPRSVQALPDFWDQADFTLVSPKIRAPQTRSVTTSSASVQVEFLAPPGPATVSVALKTRGLLVATGQATASLVPGANALAITLAPYDELVMTLAGELAPGFVNGTGQAARFNQPQGLTLDAAGNLYVADYMNHSIRKVSPKGEVSTLAGNGTFGWADGVGAAARFTYPTDLAYDGTTHRLYVADTSNHVIRRIDLATGMVTTPAGSPSVSGFNDGTGDQALFNTPYGVAVDAAGDVFIGDFYNQCIRRMTPAGAVSLHAGTRSAGSYDGSLSSSSFNGPKGLTVDAAGNLFVIDYFNNRIRKISAGTVTTVAGSTLGYQDGPGSIAKFNRPATLVLDGFGGLVVGDSFNNTIRTVSAGGTVGTMFPTATASGYVDGLPVNALFRGPVGVALRGDRLYVSDTNNHCIRVYRRTPTL